MYFLCVVSYQDIHGLMLPVIQVGLVIRRQLLIEESNGKQTVS
jgi:hypothetical protein